MACLTPFTIKHPTLKAKGFLPLSATSTHIQVPCGKCINCLKRKRNDWSTRLNHELRFGGINNAFFVTFTLETKYLSMATEDSGKPIRLFLERYRKIFGKSLRHWFVTELGEKTNRLHYHGIIFNVNDLCLQSINEVIDQRRHRRFTSNLRTREKNNLLYTLKQKRSIDKGNRKYLDFSLFTSLWSYGQIWVGWCNPKTCSYIVKYLSKGLSNNDFKPKIYTSYGLGLGYITSRSYWHRQGNIENYKWYLLSENGWKMSMPIYYKNKIFTKVERLFHSRDLEANPPPLKIGKMTYTDEKLYYHDLSLYLAQYAPLIISTKNLQNKQNNYIFANHNNTSNLWTV